MCEKKFTDGEWSLVDDRIVAKSNWRTETIAELDQSDEMLERGEYLPNGHLIAAAPDLFTACEKALQLRALHASSSSEKISILERKELQREISEIESSLRAALAKGKGE